MGQSSAGQRNDQLTGVGTTAGNWYNQLMGAQTPLEQEYIPQSQQMWNNYQNATNNDSQDYGNIMQGYQNYANNLGGPTNFTNQNVSAQQVSAERPEELTESYGYLRETMPGYRDFAKTGGYSPTDIQELRARGISPIRSAYSNTMMEMDRARAIGGAGGSPNYIAAASKAQREMPGQMADAMTGVNAELANAIRQGKLAGLSGMAGVGSTMGGLSSQEAARLLQAATSNQSASLQASMANQNADLQRQQLSEQSLQNLRQSQLAGLSGQTNLYGTTPGRSSMFGNQALQAYQNRISLEGQRNQTGLGLLDAQIRAYGGQSATKPWWEQALGAAGSVLPYLGGGSRGGGNQSISEPGMGQSSFNQLANDPNTIWGSGVPNQTGQAGQTGQVSSNWYVPGMGGSEWDGQNNPGSSSYNDPYLDGNNYMGGVNPWSWNFGNEYQSEFGGWPSGGGGWYGGYGREVGLDPNLGGGWG